MRVLFRLLKLIPYSYSYSYIIVRICTTHDVPFARKTHVASLSINDGDLWLSTISTSTLPLYHLNENSAQARPQT